VGGLAGLGLLVEVAGIGALMQALEGSVDRRVSGRRWWLHAGVGRPAFVHGHERPAELLVTAFAAVAPDFFAVDVLAADFFVADFLAAVLVAVAGLVPVFFVVDFVAPVLFVAAFFVEAFLVAAFLVAAFLVDAFVVAAFVVAAFFVAAFLVTAGSLLAPAIAVRGGRRRGGADAGSSTGAVRAASTTRPSSADLGLIDATPPASAVAAGRSTGRDDA
jgi:hypothetical protein